MTQHTETRTPTQHAGDLCDLLLVFEAQKKTLAEDKRRLDEAMGKARFDLARIMQENDMTVFGTPRATATIETTEEYAVDDWGDLYAHIGKTGDFDLLHRRLSATAVAERVLAGAVVPGVGTRPVTVVKVKPTPK